MFNVVKGGMMKKRRVSNLLAAMGSLLLLGLFVVASGPALALTTEDRIKALEEELSQLKTEQVELQEDALAAKKKKGGLPKFSYRPRRGITITGANKEFSWNMYYEYHVHMYNYTDGVAADGFAAGDLFFRRNRPRFRICWAACFYEIRFGFDMDTGDIVTSQDTALYIHMEKMNPWLPTIGISDKGGQSSTYVSRSSSSSAHVEMARDLLVDSNMDVLSHQGIGLGWINVPVGQGDALFWIEYKPCANCDQNAQAETDRKQLFVKFGMRPWRKSKSKWLKRIKLGGSINANAIDPDDPNTGNKRLRLRTMERQERIVVFDRKNVMGEHLNAQFGMEWGAGPYLFRFAGAHAQFDGSKSGNSEGLFTGGANKAGSLLLGWRFLRADAECKDGADCVPGGSHASGNHLIGRELDLWYWIRPGFSVGMWWMWWSTPNMPSSVYHSVGCGKEGSVGKDCDWHTVNMGARINW
jgi:hypothetical protein